MLHYTHHALAYNILQQFLSLENARCNPFDSRLLSTAYHLQGKQINKETHMDKIGRHGLAV